MRFSILTILLFYTVECYSQLNDAISSHVKANCSDTVYFDGYYLVLCKKNEIKDLERNRKRRLAAKPYQVSFESKSLIYFVSLDSIFKKGFRAVIKEIIQGKNRELFVECTKEYPSLFSETLCLTKDDLLNCDWPNFSSENRYYTTRKRINYCFKIYKLSGWFKKIKVDTEEKRGSFGRRSRIVDPTLKEFNAYFFWKVDSFSSEISSVEKQIKLWREVPSLFE